MATPGAFPGKGNNTHIHFLWRNLMQSFQFDFYKLGWKVFEVLVSCLLKETHGQTFKVLWTVRKGHQHGLAGSPHPVGYRAYGTLQAALRHLEGR